MLVTRLTLLEFVVHYDDDYALISDVTGQPQRRIVPRGTLATRTLSP